MDRLISANKLEDALHDLMKRKGVKSWLSTVFDAVDFETLIDEAETVEETKCGSWERMDEYCFHAKTFRCSVCKNDVEYPYFTRFCDYDFCPNCGANMKEEEE